MRKATEWEAFAAGWEWSASCHGKPVDAKIMDLAYLHWQAKRIEQDILRGDDNSESVHVQENSQQ